MSPLLVADDVMMEGAKYPANKQVIEVYIYVCFGRWKKKEHLFGINEAHHALPLKLPDFPPFPLPVFFPPQFSFPRSLYIGIYTFFPCPIKIFQKFINRPIFSIDKYTHSHVQLF